MATNNSVLRLLLRPLLIAFGTSVVLFLGATAIFLWAAPGLCENETISAHPSPDGRHRVVVFQRNCGATTGANTQASLLGTDEALENEEGNLFIADTEHGAAPSGPGGGPKLDVLWEDEHTMVLSVHRKARVFKKVPKLKGVRVIYSGVNANPSSP